MRPALVLAVALAACGTARDLDRLKDLNAAGDLAAIADTAVNRRWWAYMRDLMATNPDNSPVRVELREVFHVENRLS